jgi:hypothetical protein
MAATERRIQVSVPIDRELRAFAEAEAKRERRPLAQWIRLQIERVRDASAEQQQPRAAA